MKYRVFSLKKRGGEKKLNSTYTVLISATGHVDITSVNNFPSTTHSVFSLPSASTSTLLVLYLVGQLTPSLKVVLPLLGCCSFVLTFTIDHVILRGIAKRPWAPEPLFLLHCVITILFSLESQN